MVMLTNSQINQFNGLLNKITTDDEFEVMFNNYKNDNKLSIVKFMNILKYMKYRSVTDKMELKHNIILDVILDQEANNYYRVSISGLKNINNFLNLVHQRSNHVLFLILLTQSEFLKNENFTYMKKQKDVSSIIDIDQFDIRIRKSTENILTEKDIEKLKNSDITSSSKICFRYKNRITLDLIDNKDEKLALDLTIVQFNSNVNNILSSPKGYEIELDYTTTSSKKNVKIQDNILEEMNTIKKILESTDILLSKEDSQVIVEAYKKLVGTTETLYTMQPISAEVQHVIDKIPNFYSVTDKADGDKNQLFIHNKHVYLINCNMMVKKTKYISELNNTVLEGEIIHLVDEQKYIFMGFDCLFYAGKDLRDDPLLKNRLKYLSDVCKDLNKNIYEIKDFTDKFTLENEEIFYNKEIEKFYNNLSVQIEKLKPNEIFFHPKLFLFPTGGSNCEVYMFANLIWDYYSKSQINYKLDGIIFTGMDQKYSKDKREHKFPIYKYKPPVTNSIDIFVTYQRNLETNSYLEIFDNSIPNNNNQIYRVANFYVGDVIGNKEVPVPFMKNEGNHEAYFPLVNNEVRDQDGNYIQDNTVIEVVYNNDPSIPHPYRWMILRTRWDKTEDVYKHQKRYGNFKDVAIKTWKSIREAVTFEEIKNLARPSTYVGQQKSLQLRVDSSVITSERQQDVYYQKITSLCKKMREFHNWIKSIIIYTYCSPYRDSKGKMKNTTVLDLGCGRGGDLMRWYHARVGEYVGIDTDYYTLYSSIDGMVFRYNQNKNKYPNFPKVHIVYADPTAELDANIQENKLPNMAKENKQLIEKIFTKSRKFDCISAMFSLHYFFDKKESIDNLVKNIKNYLIEGGYLIFTLFDAKLVMEKLGESNKYTTYYTDDEGNRRILFEIIKKFEGPLENKEGLPIDVYLDWIMQEGKHITEYLVTPELLDQVMERAGCRLIESDTFSNIYTLNHQYFTQVIEHEENPKNYQFYKKVAKYYEELKGADKESKAFTFLNRYYIYQKIE